METRTGEAYPDPDPTIDVYARWSGYVQWPTSPQEFLTASHSYLALKPPSRPLKLGMAVRIIALSPAKYHSPYTDGHKHDTYDPHVGGRLTKVLGWRDELIVLEVTNECTVNPVKLARLEVPYIPGRTVVEFSDLRPGQGPRIAEESAAFNLRLEIGQLPQEAQCAKSGCTPRASAFLGEEGAEDPRPEDTGPVPGKPRAAPRKKPGPLEAVGWSRRDHV